MRISSLLNKLCWVLLLLSAWPALAAERETERGAEREAEKPGRKDEFQIHYQAALQQYKKENFELALTEFQKAYEQDPLPRLQFNIGQLQKKLGHVREAIDAYELFLKNDTGLSPKQRDEVQRLINELRGSDPALEPAPAALLPGAEGSSQDVKAGRFMANLGIGFGVGLNTPQVQAALQLEAGYSILKNRNGYIIVPLQFHLSDSFKLIMIPVGFHYDVALPIRGLFFGARASIGYAVGFVDTPSVPFSVNGALVTHLGVVVPELSLKYVLKGRINLGVAPLSFPILFNDNGAIAYYRLTFFGGANF